ncbi:MAG: DUF6702 family protein [Acidobacteriota bacterium]
MRRAAALAFTSLWLSAGARAHPFHASHAEVDYRADCGCLEVALAVVPEELEAALERMSGRRIPVESPEAESEIVDYLKTRFVVAPVGPPGGEPLPIEWLGREVSYREAWLYFKVTGVTGDFDLADRVLFEAEQAQVNHLLLRGIGETRTLTFRAGEAPVRIRP